MLATEMLMFCRWSIGLTFAASAIGKARDLRAFDLAVVDLAGVPPALARPAALATVLAEALVVLALAVGGLAVPVGFGLAAGLLLLFSVVLVAAVRRRGTVSCNCFGAGERPISSYDLARNGVLLACCVAGLVLADRPRPPAAVIVLLGLMAGCFVLIVTNTADIVELLRKPYQVD